MNNSKIKHEEFIRDYRNKKLSVYSKPTKAIGLILSKHAALEYKPGIIFFSCISIIFIIIFAGSLIYLFINFREAAKVASLSLACSFGIAQCTMKVASDLVKKEMIDSEAFFNYIINEKKSEVYISKN